jgi:Flp pilus assembly protein TadD
VSRDPRDDRAWAGLGEVWLEVDRYPDAVAAFSKSLEIEPRSAEVHNSLAIALNLQGRRGEALRHFRTAVALAPLAEFAANLEKAEAEAARGGTPR